MTPLWSVPPLWPGRTVVIVGGGPSLTLEAVHRVAVARLEGRCRVIVVNDAVFPCWWADWLHASDGDWWHRHVHGLNGWPGIRTTIAEDLPPGWRVGCLRTTGEDGFDDDPGAVRHGSNGGYVAIHLAAHAGAANVLLLGFDMRAEGHRTHWHSGHPYPGTRQPPSPPDYRALAATFETLKPALAERGIMVLNCSPGSALKAFPMGRIFDVL